MKHFSSMDHIDVHDTEWYHQLFDGSPMYLYPVAEAETRVEERKIPGTEALVRMCFFENGSADWYLDMRDVHRGAQAVIDEAYKNPHLPEDLVAAWKDDEDTFEHFFYSFLEKDLSALSDEELLALFQEYTELFINRLSSSCIIDHFALGTDTILADMLRKEIGDIESESAFTHIFSVATAPIHQSFINEAEIALLRIALDDPHNEAALAEHQQKYFWTNNNYIDAPILSVEHFKKEIENITRSSVPVEEQLKKLEATPERNKKEKEALFAEHTFSSELMALLHVSELFTKWQDDRKKSTFMNIHIGVQILTEMASRRKVDPELTKFMIGREIADWFIHNAISQEDLVERKKKSAFVVTKEGYYIAVGSKVDDLKKQVFAEKSYEEVDDIRGITACTGRAVGTVRVIKSARDAGDIEEGDILVAVMTRPDYIHGMKKAGAIVTNEGGVTCHAAIVSRELGIPCIIGTKVATEVLRDGDTVEVNANHGWVKKVSV